MFQAIAAVIGAIIGFGGKIYEGTNLRYLQRQEEYEAAIDYNRQKTLGIYDAYGNEAKTRTLIIVGGIVAIVLLVYILNKKKK
jgi:hypothetical protein